MSYREYRSGISRGLKAHGPNSRFHLGTRLPREQVNWLEHSSVQITPPQPSETYHPQAGNPGPALSQNQEDPTPLPQHNGHAANPEQVSFESPAHVL